MSTFCTIDSKIVSLLKVNIKQTLDEVGSFTIEIPSSEIDIRNIRGAEVIVYRNNTQLISGYVHERIGFTLKENGNVNAKLKCFDELGRLTREAAITTLHIQDTLVTTVIDNILSASQFTSWTRTNVNFENSATETVTIDLRSKDTMFSQIVEVVKAVPSLHLRYGGVDSFGARVLEIGNFNQITEQFTQGVNLQELQMSPLQETQYSQIYAVGGLSGDTRVTLANALADPRYATDPLALQFPIKVNPISGQAYIDHLNSNVENAISKSFNFQKTNNETDVTETEIAEAGYSLWKKAISFIQSYGEFDTYTGAVITNRIPLVGDRAIISSVATERAFNELTMSYDEVEVFEVLADLRIVGVETSLEEYEMIDEFALARLNNEIIVDFEVTSGEQAQEFDESIILSDEPISEGTSEANLNLFPVQLVEVAHFGSAVNDCSGGGITNGKLFQFDFTPPVGATGISYVIVGSTPSNALSTINQSPLVGGTPLILCVAPSNGAWNTLSATEEIAFRVLYSFS